MKDETTIKVVMDSSDELLTVPDVAKRIGTEPNFVRDLLKTGLLPYISFGRYKRVRKFALNKFLAQCDGIDLTAKVAEYKDAAKFRECHDQRGHCKNSVVAF